MNLLTQTKSLGTRVRSLAEFRLIPRVETFPGAVSFAQTPIGKATMLAAFGCMLCVFVWDWVSWLGVVFTISLISFVPSRRRIFLAVAPILLVVIHTFRDPLRLSLNLGVIVAGVLLYSCALRWPNSRFGKRPVLFLLTGFSAIILIASTVPRNSLPHLVLWSAVGIFASYVWFIAYALVDRHSTPAKELTLELTALRPLWGSTNTPFPKGAAYLRRIEAKTPEQLAVVQLKGLKLLLWAILLALFQVFWNKLFHGILQIPTAGESLDMSVRGSPALWHLRWESQILYFFEVTLQFAIVGHQFISICRMAGFNALRNSYRPLSSTTIAEFFNRFYYYFKELLVDLFYYPAFLRYWKGHKRVRVIFATFSAVLLGNSFFHLTRDLNFIEQAGVWRGLVNYQVLFFYNVTMASALSISQLRKRKPKPNGFFRREVIPRFGVISFYCLLSVFGDERRLYPLTVHFKYLASLFLLR